MAELNPAYAAFVIKDRDSSEAGDENRPKNIAQAIQLFHHGNMEDHAKKSKQCVDRLLKLLQDGPDGASKFTLGEAIICWACGHVGIPKNFDEYQTSVAAGSDKQIYGQCSGCNSAEQTNFVNGVQPDGSRIPWIEKEMHIPENANAQF
jgi:hypothetical protein